MKTIYKYAAAIAIGASALVSASAQNTYSGYFLDNYTYRYQLNPAFGSDKNFVSIPGIGNINASLVGNLNLGDVLYNVDGQTVLFTNPDVSTQQVMANINDDNHLESNIKLNILSAGFKAFGGFNTISINARTNVGFNIPGTMFSLAKEGLSNKSYDISNIQGSDNVASMVVFVNGKPSKNRPSDPHKTKSCRKTDPTAHTKRNLV